MVGDFNHVNLKSISYQPVNQAETDLGKFFTHKHIRTINQDTQSYSELREFKGSIFKLDVQTSLFPHRDNNFLG